MDTSPIRFTGLFSGMDTAGMVQQLMRAEAMRMDRFVRRRQTLAWRQEDLRNTITNLEAFRRINTYTSTVGSMNNPATWNAMRATVTNADGRINPAGINVSAPTANARAGSFDVTVLSVAQGDMVRGGVQFRGTSVGTDDPLNREINLRYTMRYFMGDTHNWANAGNDNFVFIQERDAAGRIRFDLSSLGTHQGITFGDNVWIALDDNNNITSLRIIDDDGTRDFTLHNRGDDDNPDWVLRHRDTDDDGNPVYTYIERDVLQNEIVAGEGFGVDGTAHNDNQGMRYVTQNYFTYVQINGADIRVNQNDTIQDFMDSVNRHPDIGVRMSFSLARGAFVLESTRMGEDARVFTGTDTNDVGILEAFGLDNIRDNDRDGDITHPGTGPEDRLLREQQGARVRINDGEGNILEFESDTNTFTGDRTGLYGINFTISQAASPTLVSGQNVYQTFTIEVGRNVENTMNAIRQFVDNFNDLLRTLNALHSTPRPRQNGNFFEPLTDAERAEMSDREIERWEEQARIGLLHRNDSIRNLHQDLRNAIFRDVVIGPPGNRTTVNFSEFFTVGGAPSREDRSIGIIDVDWERLEQELLEDPERIQALFARDLNQAITDNRNPDGSNPAWASGAWTHQRNSARADYLGLGWRIRDIIENATHFDGSIRRQVGMVGSFDDPTSPMSRQIQQYDARLQQMQRWLIRRENHFFAMFARMEQAMANANAQMDSLWMMGGM